MTKVSFCLAMDSISTEIRLVIATFSASSTVTSSCAFFS
ncbi:Uncharacterised protein [Vibrio cholerae]|nr:Uncharacterised protein [Vibrio cholerae]